MLNTFLNENYVKLYSNKIIFNKKIKESDIVIIHYYNLLYFYDVNDVIRFFLENPNFEKRDLCFGDVHCTKFLLDYFLNNRIEIYPFLEYDTNNLLKIKPKINNIIDDNFFKNGYNVFLKLNKRENNFYLDIFIRKDIIKNLYNTRHVDYNYRELLLKKGILDSSLKITNSLYKILDNTPQAMSRAETKLLISKDVNFPFLKKNTFLYNYQKNDVYWMKMIEELVDTKKNTLEFSIAKYRETCINVDGFDYEFVYYKNKFIPKNNLTEYSGVENIKLKFYGGNLISEMGLGKCHAKNTPILMYDGNIKMVQDVKIGELLMGDDSKPRTVLSLANGNSQMYDILPNLPGFIKYNVNIDHILCLINRYIGNIKSVCSNNICKNAIKMKWFCVKEKTFIEETVHYTQNNKIETFNKIKKFLENNSNNVCEIPVKEYINLSKKTKRVLKGYKKEVSFENINFLDDNNHCNSYVLGMWLGSSVKKTCSIVDSDTSIEDYVVNKLPITEPNSNLAWVIKKYNLNDIKYIPDIYMYSSKKNRLDFLKGLLKSKSIFNEETGKYKLLYNFYLKRLIDDILFLCNSLGIYCYSNIERNRNSTEIAIFINGVKNKNIYADIKIVNTGYDEYFGFTLDGNNRYLLGDFTVTHNTMTALSNIFREENKYDSFVEFDKEHCNYFFKRGKNKTKKCSASIVDDELNCKEILYCKEHSECAFIEKRGINFKNIELFNNEPFVTNSTLVICPNQLCDQWVREYYGNSSNFNVEKRVILLSTFDQFSNLTFGDILFSDLIIVSFNFLCNNNYNNYCKKDTKTNYTLITKDILNGFKMKNLSFFKWRAVYCDEFHEVKTRTLISSINSFKSTYKWNISGTPFSDGKDTFINSLNLITNIEDVNVYTDGFLNNEIIDKSSRLFRRNTKESIKEELNMNTITERVELLNFTIEERSIYDSYNSSFEKFEKNLIQLCCDPQMNIGTKELIKNCKTFDEIRNVILKYNFDKLEISRKKIKDLEKYILEEHNSEELSVYKRNLTIEKKNCECIDRVYSFLKNAVDNIKVSETCPICLDEIDIDNTSMTKCGHKFCWDCISEYIKEFGINNSTKCPMCNIKVDKSDIYFYKETEIAKKVDNLLIDNLVDIVNDVKSTKIGNIVYYVKNLLKNDKCIIFSQHNELLKKIGDYLKKYDVNVLYCSGNVYNRKNTIEKFKNDCNQNVICLSSKNSASGINLTVANKIILVEPICGDTHYRNDIENQAIGRANRLGRTTPLEIIRFIIKDTIESKLHYEQKNNNL